MKDSSKKQKRETESGRNIEHPGKFEMRLLDNTSRKISKKQSQMADKLWADLTTNYSFIEGDSDSKSHLSSLKTREFHPLRDRISVIQNSGSGTKSSSTNKGTGIGTMYDMDEEHLKFIKAIQLSQSFVIIIDRNGIIEYANPQFQSVSGYTIDELQGKEFGFLISELASQEEYEQVLQALKAGVSWKGELVNTKKNGEWYIFTAKISPVSGINGTINDYIVVGHDVTSFRETEIKLEQAVEEKTILLSELHHRVKNNLAIISGIMQLQAFEEKDDYLKSKLFSSVGRVKTLASMHELLYESNSFSKLEFGKNIKRIVAIVSEMFEYDAAKVDVEYDLEPIILNINQAHACALLMNEVITNTYKQTSKFPENKISLKIKLVCFGKKVVIEVKDNVQSLPEGYTTTYQPLSLQLIKTLTKQINGQFNYLTDDHGTLFTVTFEKENQRGAANVRLT